MLILMIGRAHGAERVMTRFGFQIPAAAVVPLMEIIMPEAVTREKLNNKKKAGLNSAFFNRLKLFIKRFYGNFYFLPVIRAQSVCEVV